MGAFLVVVLLILLLIFLLLPLKFFNISVPDLPLSDFTSQIISNWRSGSGSLLFDIRVDSLDLTTFVIELVSHRLLDGLNIFA